MVNYGRVQFVSIELGISPITLIHNRLHTWECFLVAPQKEKFNELLFLYEYTNCCDANTNMMNGLIG